MVTGCLLIIFDELLSFLMTAGCIKLICWAFGFRFTWKLAIGIWFLLNF